MAVSGEPIHGRHGVLLYSAQSVKGTPVTPATPIGAASFDVTIDGDLKPIHTLGKAELLAIKPGLTKTDFSIQIEAVQNLAVLSAAIRSGGVLPWVTFGFGWSYDSGGNYAKQVQDCKVHRAEISLEAEGMLTASLSGVGGLVTDVTTLVAAHLTDKPFTWYEATFTKGGVGYEIRSFNVSIEQNVNVQACIPGVAPSSFARGWKYQTEGNYSITGEITRYALSGVNVQADCPADFDLVLTMTDKCDSEHTLTITASDCQFGQEKFTLSPENELMVTLPFIASGISIE